MAKVKASKKADPNKLFSGLSIDKVCMKVSVSIKDPLRKSMPDTDEAKKIQSDHKMSDNAVRVNINLLDKTTVKDYRDPIKELRETYTENTLPVASGKQNYRLVSIKHLSKLRKDLNDAEKAVKDGVIKFMRHYGTPEFVAEQQSRLGDKYSEDLFKEKELLQKEMKSIVSIKIEPFATEDAVTSAGVYLNPEDVASIQKSMDSQNQQIRDYANQTLWTDIMKSVQEISDVCSKEHGSGKGSIFRNTMIPKVKQLLDTIPALNFDGDQNLEKVRGKCEELLKDVDNDTLREDPKKRKEVADASSDILADIKSYRPAHATA